MNWIEVGKLTDVPKLGARVVRTAHGDIAVFRTAGDEVFALDDKCPHKGGPLSQGIVFDNKVSCPLHNWVIDLEQGCAIGPDTGCTKRHTVKIEGGYIYMQIDARAGVVVFSGKAIEA